MSGTSAGAKRGWAVRRARYGASGTRRPGYENAKGAHEGLRARMKGEAYSTEPVHGRLNRPPRYANKRGSAKTEREMTRKAFPFSFSIAKSKKKKK